MEICSNKYCTGCGACVALCPVNAIQMERNEKGFEYPVINVTICINCGQCIKHCPVNCNDLEMKKPLVYAGWNTDKNRRIESTSGGIFSVIANDILRQNGSVFGVRWTEQWSTEHTEITTMDDFWKIQNSKYVQCNSNNTFKRVKERLDQDRFVLFSGTPCQIAGLKSYLGKNYAKLFTIDVVCHGVPSYKVFKRYLCEVTDNKINSILAINLRYKKPGWSYASVKIDFSNKGNYLVPTVDDPYFCLFNFNYSLRESCYHCKYTSITRQGDITLADFWGYLPKQYKMRNFDDGVSCILINTENGQNVFNRIKTKLVFEEKKLEEAINSNASLKKPYDKPENDEDYWKDFIKGETINNLSDHYIEKKYLLPKHYWLRKKYHEMFWLLKK